MSEDKLPWLSWLNKYVGEPEYTGTTPTAFIEECFRHTNYGSLHGSTPPSCAATLCAALEESGYLSPHSARALDFTAVGLGCALKPGAIAVFQWKDGSHHVSVCQKVIDDNYAIFLNGNQGHMLQPATYARKYIIAIRWPMQMQKATA